MDFEPDSDAQQTNMSHGSFQHLANVSTNGFKSSARCSRSFLSNDTSARRAVGAADASASGNEARQRRGAGGDRALCKQGNSSKQQFRLDVAINARDSSRSDAGRHERVHA